MGIDNIWVFAQAADGAPTTGTLELLTKARSLGGTVSAFIAGDGAAVAAALGDHGAAKVYSTGDLGGALAGVAVSAAMQAVIAGGDVPDLIMFPQSYEGRDVMARLSVKLDRTVLTNSTSLTVDGDTVTVQTPVFGGTKLVNSTFTGERPFLAAFRPKSFVAEGGAGAAGEVVAGSGPGPRIHRWGIGHRGARRGDVRSEARRGGRRRRRWSWTRRGRQVRDDRVAGQGSSRVRPARRGRSSTPVGFRTATRSARPARSSSRRSTSPPASPAPRSTWWA